MRRRGLALVLLSVALASPLAAGGLATCEALERCPMESRARPEPACHGPSLTADECCLRDTPAPPPSELRGLAPAVVATAAAAEAPARTDGSRRGALPAPTAVRPLYTLFRSLLI
ncbi:MAG: hypothetical protein R3325_00525 [Thermoanaerobaculia bacterium]|nr:hypothetical protein [Thermoanaerobaculia bacterium]